MRTPTERVDDLPLLISEFEKSDLSELLSKHFPDHGHWEGIDGGKVAVGFLTYVLSKSDHRLSHVEQWAKDRLTTLRYSLNEPELTEKDFTDDKLGSRLDRYSDKAKWDAFEHEHNKRLINVYDLKAEPQAIRLDAMIVQSYRQASGDFQCGHSKQYRADLPQLKTMVATLDPMAMPLYSLTVPGNTADDTLYWPCIENLIDNLPLKEQLFVGDSKMGSLKTRSQIHSRSHYYLAPLGRKQCSEDQLAAYIQQRPSDLVQLTKENKDGSITQKPAP